MKIRWPKIGIAAAVAAASVGLVAAMTRAQTPAAPTQTPPPQTDKLPAAGEFKPFEQVLTTSNKTNVSFEMMPIPGGKFTMGSPESEKDREDEEGPQFEVDVEPFYMGKYEVTWDVYNLFLERYAELGKVTDRKLINHDQQADAISYPTPIYDLEAGPALQRMGGREGKLPAVIMSHFAAKQFTKWLSAKTGRFYRLPTEAEWEYAARGGTKTAYFFGDDGKKDLKDYAWYMDNSELKDGDTGYHKVGLKKPNPYGLYDIYGNVGEIVIDQWDAKWYGKFEGKSVSWRDAIRWPTDQYPRTARGGGYESDVEQCRSASREKITVNNNQKDPQLPKSPYWLTENFSVGMRLVSPVKEPTEQEKEKFWNVDNESVDEILKRDREVRELFKDVKPQAPAAGASSPAGK